MKKIFLLFILLFSFGLTIDCVCNSCEDCTNKTALCDKVILNDDIFATGDCIKINKSVVFDCNGHKILGSGKGNAFYIKDQKNNDLENPYMLVWRVVNNIDSNRDIFIDANTIGVDATNKSKLDNFQRVWPDDVVCTKSVIDKLKSQNLIDCDDEFIKKWGIL